MGVLVYGLILFLTAFLLHFIVWKIRLPKRQVLSILVIFFSVPFIALFFLHLFRGGFSVAGVKIPSTLPEHIELVIMYISLVLAYIATYTAIEVDSPSLVMALRIAEAGPLGLKKDVFEKEMNDGLLVLPRVRDLITGGLADLKNGRYVLTLRGVLVARIFIFYRYILARDEKGG